MQNRNTRNDSMDGRTVFTVCWVTGNVYVGCAIHEVPKSGRLTGPGPSSMHQPSRACAAQIYTRPYFSCSLMTVAAHVIPSISQCVDDSCVENACRFLTAYGCSGVPQPCLAAGQGASRRTRDVSMLSKIKTTHGSFFAVWMPGGSCLHFESTGHRGTGRYYCPFWLGSRS